VYKKDYHVDYGDSDYYKNLKLSSLFNFLQDIASLHSENLGIGINHILKKFNVAWVMIRILVDIDRIPCWNEDIIIETWPLEPKKFEFERDFIVKDRQGNVLARAISSWVILDIDKREIRKSELISREYPAFETKRAIDRRMEKLKPSGGELLQVYSRKIGYSDIDINGHLNNSKYIDYITDCFSLEAHGQYTVKSLQVSYINEAIAGETIILKKDISELESGSVYVEGTDATGDKVYFKASIAAK
jgi:acyl-ACP thioesterase